MGGELTTYVEKEEARQSLLGDAVGVGEVDSRMLEFSDTNNLVATDDQAKLWQAHGTIRRGCYESENRIRMYREIIDRDTGEKVVMPIIRDSWRWLDDFAESVMKKQLTRGGYSRMQHLGVATAAVIANSDMAKNQGESKGFFGKIFG